jgi:hypothetical protein
MRIYALQRIALGHGISSDEEEFFFRRFFIFTIALITSVVMQGNALTSGNYRRLGSISTLTKNEFVS